MMKNIAKPALYGAWVTAVLAMVGSLYASEIVHLAPCILCWYQRIFMYPLVIIVAVGILKKDKLLPFYVLPLAILGGLVAVYHNLLYWEILPSSVTPCLLGVSCTTRYVEWFGFITIPLLSFLAFLMIIICMMIIWKKNDQ